MINLSLHLLLNLNRHVVRICKCTNLFIFFPERQMLHISTTKFDNPVSETFTIGNTKPDFSSNHIISFQKKNRVALIILTIICFLCSCIIFSKIAVWLHDKRREQRNAPRRVQHPPEHCSVYENI